MIAAVGLKRNVAERSRLQLEEASAWATSTPLPGGQQPAPVRTHEKVITMGGTDSVGQSPLKSERAAWLEFVIGEHVEAFGFFTHLSDFQHISRHQMSRGAPAPGRSFGLGSPGREARALPTAMYLVLTPTRVLATSDPARARGVTADGVFGAWDRATTSIEVGDAPAAGALSGTRVTLNLLDEDRPVHLESFDGGPEDNDEILTLLRR